MDQMETSRNERRIGWAFAVFMAVVLAGWLAWITWGALRYSQSWN